MAKLSTPSHSCQAIVGGRACGRSAYRKDADGKWKCKPHGGKTALAKSASYRKQQGWAPNATNVRTQKKRGWL